MAVGLAATVGAVSHSTDDQMVLVQILASLGVGGGLGAAIASRIAITSLPQMVRPPPRSACATPPRAQPPR